MNKIKIISIVLGLFLTSGAMSLGLVYKKNIEEKKELNSKIEQLRKEIKANESAENNQVLGTSEVKEEIIVEKPPVYIPPVVTNPIVNCSKGKCDSKSVKQSVCFEAICCETKKDTYKWATNQQECDLLIHENEPTPENNPIIIDRVVETTNWEAETRAREAEECQRKTAVYLKCTNDFNESMSDYADCQERSNDVMQKYNDDMQEYSECVNDYNEDLDAYNDCVDLYTRIGGRPDISCSKPFSNSCRKPTTVYPGSCLKPKSWCTKPSCF